MSNTPITDAAKKAWEEYKNFKPIATHCGSWTEYEQEMKKWVGNTPPDGWQTAKRLEGMLAQRHQQYQEVGIALMNTINERDKLHQRLAELERLGNWMSEDIRRMVELSLPESVHAWHSATKKETDK